MVPAMIVAVFGQAHGVAGWGFALGMLIGLLIYIPAIVIDSFRSKRRVELAPWFGRLPLSARILLVVLAVAVAVVIGIARAHL
jgi:hypothetical protein